MKVNLDHWWWAVPDLLTVREVAEILRVHPNTVYNWIHSGYLKAHKVGSAWRIEKEDLQCLSEKPQLDPPILGRLRDA